LRASASVDAEARRLAYAAVDAGRAVLLHRLDSSKTGRSGLTGVVASQIMTSAPARIVVLVDCCQLRCSRRRIRRYLAQGFMVAITGSKFFGGPPFSGALLLPPRILRRIGGLALPDGLSAYSSRLDWPPSPRERSAVTWMSDANLGLGLRWIAALDEMERFYAIPAALRGAILRFFEQSIIKHSQSVDNLVALGDDCQDADGEHRSILGFAMTHPDGEPFSSADTARVHARLRTADPASPLGFSRDRAWHLGQPVVLGPRTALRVCASAPMVSEVVARVGGGETLEQAFAQWDEDLETMFGAWSQAMRDSSARSEAPAAVPRRASQAP
jgi:hypothetical protein